MPYATGSGVTLYYEIAGEGPPLCLINGYRLSGDAWPRSFIARLATRCTVISFDNRGTGRSDKPADDMTSPVWRRTPSRCICGFAAGPLGRTECVNGRFSVTAQ